MILRVLMQFKLSSCFATHSEAVAVAVVVDCPNLHRPHTFIPPLHHSSITLAALFSSSPFSLIPSPYYPFPISLQYIYSAAKVFDLSLQISKNVL